MAIVVKNTFLDVEQRNCAEKRCSSIPRSFKPSVFVEQLHASIASTFKPSVSVDQPPQSSTTSTSVFVDEPQSRTTSTSVFVEQPQSNPAPHDSVLRSDSIVSEVSSADILDSRAGSKSRAESNFEWEPSMRFKFDFGKVIKRSIKMLCRSELISNVQRSERLRECLLTVQMSASGALQKEQVQTLVKETLLYAVVPSKSIYIIGFRASPFIKTEFGFDLKYVAMENASSACWYFFKKGVCRHGDICHKTHAVWEMPVRVRIEAAPSESVASPGYSELKQEM